MALAINGIVITKINEKISLTVISYSINGEQNFVDGTLQY